MVNSEEFTNRLKKILEHHDLTASLFADNIGVQRSSISHILSGRNKPSLDFILKVTTTFKDVDIHWLLNGRGSFPIKNTESHSPTSKITNQDVARSIFEEENADQKKIQRIVVFYTDGTFDEYQK